MINAGSRPEADSGDRYQHADIRQQNAGMLSWSCGCWLRSLGIEEAVAPGDLKAAAQIESLLRVMPDVMNIDVFQPGSRQITKLGFNGSELSFREN